MRESSFKYILLIYERLMVKSFTGSERISCVETFAEKQIQEQISQGVVLFFR